MTAAAYEMEIATLRARVTDLEEQLAGRRRSDAERQRRRRQRLRHVTSCDRNSGVSRDTKSAPLLITLGTRLEQPRCDFSIAEQQTAVTPGSGPLVLELLVVMNRTLGQMYEDYRPVRGDNWYSNEAARDFEAVGMDPAWAAAELRRQCVQFNRGKHGKGDLPKTLKYFRRGLLSAWSRQEAAYQLELPLIAITPPIAPHGAAVVNGRHVTPVFAPLPAVENARVTFERHYQPVQAVVPSAAPTTEAQVYRGGYDWRAALEAPASGRRVA